MTLVLLFFLKKYIFRVIVVFLAACALFPVPLTCDDMFLLCSALVSNLSTGPLNSSHASSNGPQWSVLARRREIFVYKLSLYIFVAYCLNKMFSVSFWPFSHYLLLLFAFMFDVSYIRTDWDKIEIINKLIKVLHTTLL